MFVAVAVVVVVVVVAAVIAAAAALGSRVTSWASDCFGSGCLAAASGSQASCFGSWDCWG